jgi:hypothetical protein
LTDAVAGIDGQPFPPWLYPRKQFSLVKPASQLQLEEALKIFTQSTKDLKTPSFSRHFFKQKQNIITNGDGKKKQ